MFYSNNFMGRPRLELGTYGLKVRCSTIELATRNTPLDGLEPSTHGLTVRCSNQLS